MRRKETLISTISELITKARREMLMARAIGDSKAEQVWMEAVDRLLDTYAEERQQVDGEV